MISAGRYLSKSDLTILQTQNKTCTPMPEGEHMLKTITRTFSTTVLLSLFAGTVATADSNTEQECKTHDFPTSAIADYVLGCMAANGNKFETLHQCSCSIDFISERMSYEDYEKANTVMQAQRDRGQRGVFYRDSSWAKQKVDALTKIQAESTLRCF